MARSVAEHHVRLVAETAQYEAQMKGAANSTQRLGVEQRKAAAASYYGSKAASRFGVVAQSAGYQIQDFAVQVAGGQNAMVAFSQQGSQLLGVFGAGGAIAGAVLSVGVLAARLFDTSQNAKDAAKEVDALADSYRQLSQARKDAFLARSDQLTNQVSLETDIERMRKREKALNDERERGQRLLFEATQMETGSIKYIFPTADARKQYEDALKTRGNVTAGEFGGQAFGRRSLGDFAENLILSSSEEINKIEKERIALEEKLRVIKEANFQKDRENENELMDINVKRIGAEITAEFNAAKKADEVAKWRAKKAKERQDQDVNDALNNFFSGMGESARTIAGLQNRIPQSLQMNTGASALGGVTGSGSATQIIDIQKGILEGIRTLVRMEQMASTGYN